MTLRASSTLASVVGAVGGALRRARIRAVLTGGACASLHNGGASKSYDLDFIIQSPATQKQLDAALLSVGYRRDRDRYVHRSCPFWVEFPLGPLGLGGDADVTPKEIRVGRRRVLALSATDSCRDRLAAFYHWNDAQSFKAAVEIARRQPVDLALIARWSRGEGAAKAHADFERALTIAPRPTKRGRSGPARS